MQYPTCLLSERVNWLLFLISSYLILLSFVLTLVVLLCGSAPFGGSEVSEEGSTSLQLFPLLWSALLPPSSMSHLISRRIIPEEVDTWRTIVAWASARSPANSESSGRASLSIQGAAIARGNVHQDVGSSGSSTMTCILQPRWRRVVIRGPPRSTRSHRSTAIGSPEDGLQEVSLVIDQRLQEQLPLTRGQVLRVSPEASTPPSVFSMPQPDTSAVSYSNFLRYPSIMADEHRSHSDISSLPRARSINTATLQMDTRTPCTLLPILGPNRIEERAN